MTGQVLEIWTAPAAAAPMVRRPSVPALPGLGLAGDRYALGGGTWAQYPELEKQVTLIDAGQVAEAAPALVSAARQLRSRPARRAGRAALRAGGRGVRRVGAERRRPAGDRADRG